jgi:hypothetical protein
MLDASAKGREMPPIPTPGTGPQLSKRARAFRTCEHCDYDFATDEGERGCHYYGCPSLPEELDVWCPTCLYNFMVDDGNPACGETPRCEFAVQVAPKRVAALRQWLAGTGA